MDARPVTGRQHRARTRRINRSRSVERVQPPNVQNGNPRWGKVQSRNEGKYWRDWHQFTAWRAAEEIEGGRGDTVFTVHILHNFVGRPIVAADF
jgi:hypothetical protein